MEGAETSEIENRKKIERNQKQSKVNSLERSTK